MQARDERGDTLIEVLVALAILSIAVVALMGALGTGASTTVVNRSQSQAHTALMSGAEYVKAIPLTPANFSACAPATATLTPAQLAVDPTFTVSYGPGAQADPAVPCSQLVKIPVHVNGDGFSMSVDVVRRP